MTKFLRRTWNRYPKLGKGRKKKQVWRKPKGRDNKMREKRKGYPGVVSIGYRKPKKATPVLIHNVKDLEKIREKDFVVLGNMGKKKKIEIVKKAKEKKIIISNINVEKFLKENIKPKKIEPEKTEKKEVKNKIKSKKEKK